MSSAIRSDAASLVTGQLLALAQRPVGEVLGMRAEGAVAQVRIVAEPFRRELADRSNIDRRDPQRRYPPDVRGSCAPAS